MFDLPNGCKCSELSVFPSNWRSAGASLQKDWYIKYRFYDNGFPAPKQKVVKGGINKYKTLQQRREAVRELLENELALLRSGYNPFHEAIIPEMASEALPATPFCTALQLAFDRYRCGPESRAEIKSTLKYIAISAKNANIHAIPIGSITKKHLTALFSQLAMDKSTWSSYMHNKYRAQLMSLYNVLEDMEAVEYCLPAKIKKLPPVKRSRRLPTTEERSQINMLLDQFPDFKRYIHIFFHSGARRTELMDLKVKDVDLKHQTFKVTIKKGRCYSERYKVIKDIALPLWQYQLRNAMPDDYVFSVGLVPGPTRIRTDQVTKRWRRHVKLKLGISVNMYWLKHMHTTQVSEKLGELAAAEHNSHTSVAMVRNIYDVDYEVRQKAQIRQLKNEF